MKKPSVHDVLSKLITTRLMGQKDESVNKTTCVLMYQDIFSSIEELCTTSGVKISNEAMNYLSQMYYDSVLVNGKHELDPNIFTQRASLDNLPTTEIAMLAMFMNGTPFAAEFIAKIKSRN